MSGNEKTYMRIGFFVFGAIILSILGAFLIYSNYLQGRVETYVMLFNGSLDGLDITSPITYRGVKIGEVTRIELTASKTKSKVAIPVYVEFFIEKSFVQKDNPIQILIENGIVATISAPNMFTGTARIQLIPSKTNTATTETSTSLIPTPVKMKTFHGYAMFPTQKLKEEQEETTLNDALQTAQKAFNEISKLVNSKVFQDTLGSVKDTSESINKLAISLDSQIPDTLFYISDSLKEFSKASYAARNLADYLSRHPEAILRGKL